MAAGTGTAEDRMLLRGVHLLVLWCFALPQPIFAELDEQPSPIANAGAIDLVLFAVGLTFLPPLILLLLEAVAARAGERALATVHLGLVVALAALIASPVVFRILTPSSAVQTALALGVGTAAGMAYARAAPVRSFVTALAPAPLLFVGLFLFTAPAADIVLGRQDDSPTYRTGARAPVIFLVLDEFTSTALMNSSGRLDAARFPSFGRLAADATWFRNAAADHSFSEFAVPSMLTGKDAPQDALPWVSDHPSNLFTLLDATYEVHGVERVTDLCPERLCPERGSLPGRLPSLYRELVLLGLKATLPDAFSARLPQIGLPELSPQEEFERFLNGVRRDPAPGRLHFGHVALPHSPHDRLPSGERYSATVQAVAGGGPDHWIQDRWRATQGYQRYLLQVGYTDRLLRVLLDLLEETGIYERAAIVVTADHGVSHRPGDRRRTATRTNLQEIMPVPLFVKAPNQRRGRVVDRHVQTIDILPTLADALDVQLRSRPTGRPRSTEPRSPQAEDEQSQRQDPVDRRPRPRQAAPDDSEAPDRPLRGRRRPQASIRGRSRSEVRGRRVSGMRVSRTGRTKAVLEEPKSFELDPRSEVVPARLVGRLIGPDADPTTRLLIAVNGYIRTSTRAYESGKRLVQLHLAAIDAPPGVQHRRDLLAVPRAREVAARAARHQLLGGRGARFVEAGPADGVPPASRGGT